MKLGADRVFQVRVVPLEAYYNRPEPPSGSDRRPQDHSPLKLPRPNSLQWWDGVTVRRPPTIAPYWVPMAFAFRYHYRFLIFSPVRYEVRLRNGYGAVTNL
jgi:hypothetical protein